MGAPVSVPETTQESQTDPVRGLGSKGSSLGRLEFF